MQISHMFLKPLQTNQFIYDFFIDCLHHFFHMFDGFWGFIVFFTKDFWLVVKFIFEFACLALCGEACFHNLALE